MRLVQMTSVHPWHDTRVFVKMCVSVAEAGHEVHLVVPRDDGPVREIHRGVTLHAVPPPRNRRQRMFAVAARVFEVAADLQGDLYQFHDPELLPRAVRFQDRVGRPVVFDSHEDYRLQMLYKGWLPRPLRPLIGRAVGWYEDRNVGRLAGVIAATPSIAERFATHRHCAVVQNFPLLQELALGTDEITTRQPGLFGYIGGLVTVRGVREMIDALPLAGPDIRLQLGGVWSPESLRETCRRRPGWAQVDELGFLNRAELRDMLARVSAGLVLMHPVQSYMTAYPVKMFEYMAAGLPVIASDFPLWREIVGGADCGLLVDPLDPSAAAGAMRRLADDPDRAAAMGRRGRRAVEESYNWERELKRLLAFYAAVTGDLHA